MLRSFCSVCRWRTPLLLTAPPPVPSPFLAAFTRARTQQVNDTQGLRAAKINPREVGRVVDDAFAEMTFIHGFVHADPHPGNLMVRPKVRPPLNFCQGVLGCRVLLNFFKWVLGVWCGGLGKGVWCTELFSRGYAVEGATELLSRGGV